MEINRYKLIGCKILEREFASLAYGCRNTIDITLVRQKLHDRPDALRDALQKIIDKVDANDEISSNDSSVNDFKAILIGYGLCSNVICGLHSNKYPVVIPRAHDCVTFFLGSKERYADYYKDHMGVFYFTPGFVELDCIDDDDEMERQFQFYLERYKGNEKKARKAVDKLRMLTDGYKGMAYIKWDGLDFPEYEEDVENSALSKGWTYERIEGDNTLLKRMLDGEWDEKDFLIIPPGYTCRQTYDSRIIEVCELEAE